MSKNWAHLICKSSESVPYKITIQSVWKSMTWTPPPFQYQKLAKERERERERERRKRKKERKKVTGFKNGFCLLQMKILFTYSSFIVQLFNERSISKSFSLWYFVGISRNTYSLLFGEAEIAQRQQVDGVNDIKEFTTLK